MTVGTRLREDLLAKFPTQLAAAQQLGCSEKHLSRVLNDLAPLTIDFALAIEEVLARKAGYAEALLTAEVRRRRAKQRSDPGA